MASRLRLAGSQECRHVQVNGYIPMDALAVVEGVGRMLL